MSTCAIPYTFYIFIFDLFFHDFFFLFEIITAN